MLGEASVGRLWDELLAHYYEALPDKYDPATQPWASLLERLALDIFEATRGHLSGSLRDGTFAVREEEDRWVVQFEPCGSGGRTYPGAEVPTTRSTFTESEHDVHRERARLGMADHRCLPLLRALLSTAAEGTDRTYRHTPASD